MLCLDAYKAVLRRCPLGLVLSKDGPWPVLRPWTRRACSSIQSRVSDVASYRFDRSKAGLRFLGHILGESNLHRRSSTACRAPPPSSSQQQTCHLNIMHELSSHLVTWMLNSWGDVRQRNYYYFLYTDYFAYLECLTRRHRHSIVFFFLKKSCF